MKTKTIALSLGLILAAGALYAADPMEGTWKLNESKSKLTRGTVRIPRSSMTSNRLGMGRWEVTGDGVDADGGQEGFDGKDYEVDRLIPMTDMRSHDGKPVHSEWKGRFNGKGLRGNGDPKFGYAFYTKVNEPNPQYDRQQERQELRPRAG